MDPNYFLLLNACISQNKTKRLNQIEMIIHLTFVFEILKNIGQQIIFVIMYVFHVNVCLEIHAHLQSILMLTTLLPS